MYVKAHRAMVVIVLDWHKVNVILVSLLCEKNVITNWGRGGCASVRHCVHGKGGGGGGAVLTSLNRTNIIFD